MLSFDNSKALIDKLIRIQQGHKWSDAIMANSLGINRVTWTMLRNRQTQPGRKVLQGIMRAFPELTTDVLLFLRIEVDKPTDTVEVTTG